MSHTMDRMRREKVVKQTKQLLDKGIDTAVIMEMTKLSKDAIEEIRNSMVDRP
ncbi:MAG: hypothetical protein Q8936_09195 [Bacillota bacterium]|nr:hypothetical protein [Bacillota bacterium]